MRVDLDINVFDPGDLEKLYAQDYVGEVYGSWPEFAPCQLKEMADSELAQFVIDLGNACKLPLNETFTEGMAAILTEATQEARTRLRTHEKRRRDAERYGASHWSQSDFLVEVSAVAGEGKKKGKAWWFRCPLPGHPRGDRDASLEVDPEGKRWHCWSLHGGGGVVAWRKMLGEKVGGTS